LEEDSLMVADGAQSAGEIARSQRIQREAGRMKDVMVNLGWASVFMVVSAVVGIALILGASLVIPKLLDWLTPNIDEEKEIVRGNRAVAEYFGRLAASAILSISIVIAAAIIGGILFAVLG
jgi:hypothetical protein